LIDNNWGVHTNMDKETIKGIENLESSVTASDISTAPEGIREHVDLIGDSEITSSETCREDIEA
jgi:hypothetical protein